MIKRNGRYRGGVHATTFAEYMRTATRHLRPRRATWCGLPVWVVLAEEAANQAAAQAYRPVVVFGTETRARVVAQRRYGRIARALEAINADVTPRGPDRRVARSIRRRFRVHRTTRGPFITPR